MSLDRTKRQIEIEKTNWTQLADEWLSAKKRISDQFIPILPDSSGNVRDLPPTAETVIDGMTPEQLSRVSITIVDVVAAIDLISKLIE